MAYRIFLCVPANVDFLQDNTFLENPGSLPELLYTTDEIRLPSVFLLPLELFEINTPSVLYKLMELYLKMPCDLFSFNQTYVNNKFSSNEINLILSFCKTYGLPFWTSKPIANTFINAPNQAMFGKTVEQAEMCLRGKFFCIF